MNFPILTFENRTLARLAAEVLKGTAFTRQQGFAQDRIDALMLRICRTYNVVSYHNFSHAFSLFLVPPRATQMLHQCYCFSEDFRKFVSGFELFCALLAAIAHDLNHEGTNNIFEVKLNT